MSNYKKLNEYSLLVNIMIEIRDEHISRIAKLLIDKNIVPKICLKPKIINEEIMKKMSSGEYIGDSEDLNIEITDDMYYEYLEEKLYRVCNNPSIKLITEICTKIIS